jgi:hypothetical protein
MYRGFRPKEGVCVQWHNYIVLSMKHEMKMKMKVLHCDSTHWFLSRKQYYTFLATMTLWGVQLPRFQLNWRSVTSLPGASFQLRDSSVLFWIPENTVASSCYRVNWLDESSAFFLSYWQTDIDNCFAIAGIVYILQDTYNGYVSVISDF